MNGSTTPNGSILDQIFAVIEDRHHKNPETSWTANLLESGIQRIAQKLGEEATETIIAAIGENDERLVSESCDLIYHLMVIWSARGIKPQQIYLELEKRRHKN